MLENFSVFQGSGKLKTSLRWVIKRCGVGCEPMDTDMLKSKFKRLAVSTYIYTIHSSPIAHFEPNSALAQITYPSPVMPVRV